MMNNLAADFRTHGKTMSDDGFIILPFAVPHIEFNTPTSTEKDLTVNFNRRFSGQLMTYTKR
jgi:hypothetical protein